MIRQLSITLASFLLCFCCASQSAELPVAKPEDVGMSSPKLALVVPAMQKFVDDKKVGGAITAVVRAGKIVFLEAVGKRSVDADEPLARDAIVRIYSMSKPITSVAVLLLVEEGKIALDDPVSKYLPELSDVRVFGGVEGGDLRVLDVHRPPTIRDLLRHTSGLTYGLFSNTPVDMRYRDANMLDRNSSLAEMVGKLGKLPLLHQPGTRFQYSVSTDVLGRVVEVASRESFDRFLRERVFVPLDMHDTAFSVPTEKLSRFAATHGPALGGGLRVTDAPATSPFRTDPRLLSGGGGLVSTARDYLRFCQMLLNRGELDGRRLLRAETVAEMTRNQLPDEAYPLDLNGKRPGVGFGLGVSVVVEKTDHTASSVIGEYGWGGAASTHFWISPRDDLAVVVLSQLMPFSFQLENALKPLVYSAFEEAAPCLVE